MQSKKFEPALWFEEQKILIRPQCGGTMNDGVTKCPYCGVEVGSVNVHKLEYEPRKRQDRKMGAQTMVVRLTGIPWDEEERSGILTPQEEEKARLQLAHQMAELIAGMIEIENVRINRYENALEFLVRGTLTVVDWG